MDGYDAIYTRQSLLKEESLSIETQNEFAERLCVREIRYYSDPGCSGKNTRRPDYLRMMEDVKNGKIRRILVYRLDRFSRSLLDFAEAWETLAKYNVAFISVTESFDTSTPIGEAMVFIIMVFAQLERKQIAARVRDNYWKRVSLGRWPGGPAPYGFENAKMKIEGVEVSTLSITEDMEVMKWISEEYNEPMVSLSDIRRRLNEEGIKGPQDIPWSTNTIGRLLRSLAPVKMDLYIYEYFKKLDIEIMSPMEAFCGEFGGLLVGKRDSDTRKRNEKEQTKLMVGNWEGAIDSFVWLKNQEKLAANYQIGNKGKGKHTWLTGLIKCGYCGRALVVIAYKKKGQNLVRKYLRCSGRGQELCDKVIQFHVDELEDEVQIQLQHILDTCKTVPMEPPKKSFEEQKELIMTNEKIDNLVSTLSSGKATSLTIKYVGEELEKLDARRRELEEGLIPERQTIQIPGKINFEELDFDEKKTIANSYIEKVLVYDEHIRIQWKV